MNYQDYKMFLLGIIALLIADIVAIILVGKC